MPYYLITYCAAKAHSDGGNNYLGFTNVLTDQDPIDWLIAFRKTLFPTNSMQYILLGAIPMTEAQYNALQDIDDQALAKEVATCYKLYYMRNNYTVRELPISVEKAISVLKEEFDRGNTRGVLFSKHPAIENNVIHAGDKMSGILRNDWSEFEITARKWLTKAISHLPKDVPTPPSHYSALIRRCNTCQTVTAIDLDNTPKHKQDMQMFGQTVFDVTKEKAQSHWKEAKACQCKKNT